MKFVLCEVVQRTFKKTNSFKHCTMEYLPIVKFLTNFAQRSVNLCQGRLVS